MTAALSNIFPAQMTIWLSAKGCTDLADPKVTVDKLLAGHFEWNSFQSSTRRQAFLERLVSVAHRPGS